MYNRASTELTWRLRLEPRRWQLEALRSWTESYRGVVAVVTGAGKTCLALQCMVEIHRSQPSCRFLIVVPTVALLDQWHAALVQDLGVTEEEISLIGGGLSAAPNR